MSEVDHLLEDIRPVLEKRLDSAYDDLIGPSSVIRFSNPEVVPESSRGTLAYVELSFPEGDNRYLVVPEVEYNFGRFGEAVFTADRPISVEFADEQFYNIVKEKLEDAVSRAVDDAVEEYNRAMIEEALEKIAGSNPSCTYDPDRKLFRCTIEGEPGTVEVTVSADAWYFPAP